jgi:two-component system, sensor histidine kinase LadS
MRYALLAAFGLMALLSQSWAHLGHSESTASPSTASWVATASYWHEKPGQASIEQAADPQAASRYKPMDEEIMFDLKPQDRLWIRIDTERKSAGEEHSTLWLPLPLIDSVTLYEKDAKGLWKSRRAGDRIAVASWPEPGRYPRFHMELPMGKSTLYLQVQGSTPVSLPLHLGSELQAHAQDRTGFLALGLIIGVLLTLVLTCFVTAYAYRDRLYFLYGLYMALMILAVGAYTGLAAYLLWDESPMWADVSQGTLALLAAGGALYFIEALLGGRLFARRLSVLLLSLGALAVPLAVVYSFVPRYLGVVILGVYMLLISSIGLGLAIRAWRQGNRVGQWVFLAYFPLAMSVLFALARAYGWVGVSWVVQYGVMVALIVEASMMMVALNVRSRDRHEISTREQAMATQDALTGLLKEHIFVDRLRQTTARAVKRREDAAVVMISLVNYQSIADAYGLPVAEQSVLRAVIKLRKVLRDVETVARIGTSHFGLILEGVGHRSRITDIGARLIAQGLMPLPGLVPEVTLQFHIAAALMREMPTDQRDIKEELLSILQAMSRRTRRPIRFLELTTTGGTPLANMPSNTSSAVDALAAQVSAAAARPVSDGPGAKREKNGAADSSGSNWHSTGQVEPSSTGGDTIQQPRSMM